MTTIYIQPNSDLPQFAPATGWRLWLNKLGFSFSGKRVVGCDDRGVLVTHVDNVFALKTILNKQGYGVKILAGESK